MKVLGLLAAVGMLLAQMQFASAGNINPMSQRYNAKSFAKGAKPKPAQAKPTQRQPQQPQQRSTGSSQY